jgi:hypothetical protein
MGYSPIRSSCRRAAVAGGILAATAIGAGAETRAGDGVGDQWGVTACADGTGGAVLVWMDRRGAGIDLFAQRIDATGAVAPGWPVAGVVLSRAAGDQIDPRCAAGGDGSVWVAWTDLGVGFDVRVTRLDANGIAPNWPADGLLVCDATGRQLDPALAADGANGAWVAWTDQRADGGDVYVQHLDLDGLDPGWPTGGLAVANADGGQLRPAVAPITGAGAVLAWEDSRGGSGLNVWAQRITSNGVGSWGIRNGRELCVAPGDQDRVRLVVDAGGAFVVWQDQRAGDHDAYGIRVDLEHGSAVWPWPVDGMPLSLLKAPRYEPEIAADGDGGAYITWFDRRHGNLDVFALRLGADGTEAPGWTRTGTAVCVAPGDQFRPHLASAADGAWITWTDARGSDGGDITVQRLTRFGTPHGCWPSVGTTLATPSDQRAPVVVPAAGGALVAWVDARPRTDTDVYVTAVDAEPDIGVWPPDGALLATSPGEAFFAGAVVSDGQGGVFAAWEDARGGDLDPRVQHLRADGTLAEGWMPAGMPAAQHGGEANFTCVATDGAGGVFVAWQERRVAPAVDVFVQRLDASGTVASGWSTDGRAVADVPVRARAAPCIVDDGTGGVVVAWQEWTGDDVDVRAQRLLADGSIAPGWPAAGQILCDASGAQTNVAVVALAGAFLFAWQDDRDGRESDVYAIGLSAQGGLLTGHTFDGIRLCGASGRQRDVRLATDGTGGAFVAWRDRRTLPERAYALHVRRDGSRVDGWPLDGRALDTGTAPVQALHLAADAQGGMLAAWALGGTAPGIRLVRRTAEGATSPGWPPGAVTVCDGAAFTPALVADGGGGAFVAWVDGRRGEADIFAQHIDARAAASGTLGGAPLCTAPSWQVAPALVGESACVLAIWKDERGADGEVFATRVGIDALVARRTAPIPAAAGAAADALATAVADATPRLVVGPNPMRDRTRITVRGMRAGTARVAIYDARGRLIRDLGADDGRLEWDRTDSRGHRVAAGAYLARGRAADGPAVVAKVWVR